MLTALTINVQILLRRILRFIQGQNQLLTKVIHSLLNITIVVLQTLRKIPERLIVSHLEQIRRVIQHPQEVQNLILPLQNQEEADHILLLADHQEVSPILRLPDRAVVEVHGRPLLEGEAGLLPVVADGSN